MPIGLAYDVTVLQGRLSNADLAAINSLLRVVDPDAEPLSRADIGEVRRSATILVARYRPRPGDPQERNGQILGMVTLRSLASLATPTGGQLDNLIVLPELERGRMKRTLIVAAMTLARRSGITALWYSNDKRSNTARFTKLGWRKLPVGRLVCSPGPPNPAIENRTDADLIRLP